MKSVVCLYKKRLQLLDSLLLRNYRIARCIQTMNNQYRFFSKVSNKHYNRLSEEEIRVILMKGTEWPHTGEYTDNKAPGTYICRQCNSPLYKSTSKFESSCGWPSFDDQIGESVLRIPDPDGKRVEIVCKNCSGHLGHVFEGERFTIKNTRHCVNSVSMVFVPEGTELPETIILK